MPIADRSRFDGVAVLGVDEHVWRYTRRGDKELGSEASGLEQRSAMCLNLSSDEPSTRSQCGQSVVGLAFSRHTPSQPDPSITGRDQLANWSYILSCEEPLKTARIPEYR